MNVWIFNHYAQTPVLPGGTRHFDFAKKLNERGHTVTIFASGFHHNTAKEMISYGKSHYKRENYEGIDFVWIKTMQYRKNNWKRIANMLSYTFAVLRYATLKVERRPDVVVGSSVHLFAAYSAYRISKKYHVPFVLEIRDLWPETLVQMGVSRLHPLVIIMSILEKFLYRKAVKIINLLPKAYVYMEKLGVNRNKTVWIPNGIQFGHELKVAKKEEDTSIFIIGFVGSFVQGNNIELIIQAAEKIKDKIPDIKFVLTGDGPLKEAIHEKISNLKLINIELHDPVPKKEILSFLQNFDVVLELSKNLPLYQYGVNPNKIFDYMAAARAIIYSTNAVNNIVEEAGAGVTVVPDDADALVDAIQHFHSMPKRNRDEMGDKGKQYVKKHYNIDILSDLLEKTLIDASNTAV